MASPALQCLVCPKTPRFSDVSHLLTHISSKGHLSHYFSTQVRSRQDQAAFETLQAYDHWYLHNDIEKLLSQRLLHKESRRSRRAANSTSSSNLGGTRPLQTNPVGGLINESSAAESFSHASPRAADVQAMHNVQGHRRPTHPASRMETRGQEMLQNEAQMSHMQPGNAQGNGTGHAELVEIGTKGRAWHPSELLRLETNEAISTSDNDPSKLKGMVWPGMDLFDSASTEAKRKRNQKKEKTVLAAMKTESERVEPTEVIYFPSWSIKKARFISGEVESSPSPESSPKKRSRHPSARPALAPVDANISHRRVTRSGRSQTDVNQSKDTRILRKSTRDIGPTKPEVEAPSFSNGGSRRPIGKPAQANCPDAFADNVGRTATKTREDPMKVLIDNPLRNDYKSDGVDSGTAAWSQRSGLPSLSAVHGLSVAMQSPWLALQSLPKDDASFGRLALEADSAEASLLSRGTTLAFKTEPEESGNFGFMPSHPTTLSSINVDMLPATLSNVHRHSVADGRRRPIQSFRRLASSSSGDETIDQGIDDSSSDTYEPSAFIADKQ